jgi:7-cyano-7-deazaguanine synthase in queuosine biosynthesis
MNSPLEYSFIVDRSGQICQNGRRFHDSSKSIYVNEVHRPTPPLPSIGRDLMRMGTAVLSADRLAPRKPFNIRGVSNVVRWQRKIDLRVAVEQPKIWAAQKSRLESMLRFLTDDIWSLNFDSSPRLPGDGQYLLFQDSPPSETEVVLFSGGLDSTAGLFARHSELRRPFVAVSVCGNPKQRHTQENGLKILRSLGVDVHSVSILHQIRRANPKNKKSHEESTQRARAVAYLFLAASVAQACGLSRVVSFEAGPGALNIPMSDAQVGSQNTRATHPSLLGRMEEILRGLLQNPTFTISLPYLLKTKGDVCASVSKAALREITAFSYSCDEGDAHKPGLQHCGLCTSCLMRRSALFGSLGSDDPSHYRDTPTRKHGRHDVQSYRFQALTLHEASHAFQNLLFLDPSLNDVATYIAETQHCDHIAAQNHICALFAQYAQESLRWLTSVPEIGGRIP